MADEGCEVAIIGSGPAGLANAAQLARRGIDSIVFERAETVGEGWRNHYDRLRLHTTRALSGLPGLPIPRSLGQWVLAHDFARYLDSYASHHRLRLALRTNVRELRRDGKVWKIETDQGRWRAGRVIVATGSNHRPYLPRTLETEIAWHSSRYRDPAPFRGRDVLVVGAGNSGVEIATDLAESDAAAIWLSVRSSPNILPRALLGLPMQIAGILCGPLPPALTDPVARGLQRACYGDVTRLGFPPPGTGLFTRLARDRAPPTLETGLMRAVRTGRIKVVAAVDEVAGHAVRLADESTLAPHAIIAATGYRPALAELFGGTLALDRHGLPRLSPAFEAIDAPGLHLAGFVVSPGGVLREIARQSKAIARVVAAAR